MLSESAKQVFRQWFSSESALLTAANPPAQDHLSQAHFRMEPPICPPLSSPCLAPGNPFLAKKKRLEKPGSPLFGLGFPHLARSTFPGNGGVVPPLTPNHPRREDTVPKTVPL